MAANNRSKVIQHLRRVVLHKEGAGLTDAQLLEEYLRRREEAALAVAASQVKSRKQFSTISLPKRGLAWIVRRACPDAR